MTRLVFRIVGGSAVVAIAGVLLSWGALPGEACRTHLAPAP